MEPAGAELIALMGDGSFRDTLGTLQKVLTISNDKELSEEEIAKVIGAPSGSLVNEFLTALAGKKIDESLKLFHTAMASSIEPQIFILLVVTKIRAVLLMRFAPKLKEDLKEQFGEDDLKLLEMLAGKEGMNINSQTLAELLTALIETPRAPIPEIPLELALYRALQ
jgi:DNA polymerase III gamma/tau subunit